MTLAEKRSTVRHHLEAAVRSQRESWDASLAIQDITGDHNRDIVALASEVSGALTDDEPIPQEIVDSLIVDAFASRS